MSGTYTVTMGDRGRFVVPAELRDHAGLAEGAPISLIETPQGILMLNRAQLKALVRQDLAGPNLVAELLADRRRAGKHDDQRAGA